ncbi:MAG: glycosyltransferase [Ignavibacteriaceae bacterium]|nr:glycosyltransferase [Ignavibacteriaceae bacterium]
MKALVVAPQPFFSTRGTPFSVYYRTLVSSELGVEIDFLTYGEGEDVDLPNVNIIRIPGFKFLGNVKIGPSPLKLFLDVFILFKMLILLLKNKYDFVHAHEESVFFARFMKPFFGFKLIYDMHSSLPQQLSNFNFSKSKLLLNIFKSLEDSCLKSADGVITICPDLYNYVNSIIDNKEKHFLIENSIFEPVRLAGKTKASHQAEKNEVSSELGNKDLIVYAGTLENYQGIGILIKALKYTVEKHPNAHLIIVGGSPEQVNKYSALAEQEGVSQYILFTGRVAQQTAKYYTSIAKVLVSPRSEGTNTPLKVYEQLASGIPLVATNIYSHTQVLNNDVAFLVDPTPESLGNGIVDALTKSTLRESKVKAAKKMYEEKYSRAVYTQKLKKLLELIR